MPAFLAIDHINGGGSAARKSGIYGGSKVGGSGFYRWLIKNDFPAGFQTLCHNCNLGRQINGGVCPHQSRDS